jgi:hypothetical protein
MQIRSLWFAAGALLFLSFSYTEMQGSDLWWHIAAGREILQTRTLWLVDAWSYSSAGADWLNHEWLADLIYYGWVSLWGVPSLVYWKWLVVVGAFVVLQWVLYRQSGSAGASFICAALAIAVAAPFIDIRPHLYTLLNFSLLLLLTLNRRSPTWLLVLLFVLWVNLHGGFFFGIMALGVLLFPWRDMRVETIRGAVTVGLICVAACVLNPSGIQSFWFPLTYAFESESPYRGLGEWLSPWVEGGIRSPLFFWMAGATPLVALAYVVPAVRRNVKIPWEGLILCGLTLAMAVTSRRFIPLFAMSFALVAAPLLGLALTRAREDRWGLALAIPALAFAAWRMAPYPLAAGPAYHYLTAEYSYPVDTLDFMRANNLRGNVYALYNWGGYIHWRSDGDLKVFIDGRADTIYDDQTYLDYVDVLGMKPGWESKIQESGAEYVLWPKYGYGGPAKLQLLSRSGRWQRVYQDSVSVLLARRGLPGARDLQLGPETPVRDLSVAEAHAARGNVGQALEWAGKTREAIPYHRMACHIVYSSHVALRDQDAADAVARECRGYFPSPSLPQ